MSSAPYDRAQNYWVEHPDYPHSDWQAEVNNLDTLLGYHDWVLAEIEYAYVTTPEDER